MPKTRIAVAGAGLIGRAHIARRAGQPRRARCRPSSIRRRPPHRSPPRPACRYYASLDELLDARPPRRNRARDAESAPCAAGAAVRRGRRPDPARETARPERRRRRDARRGGRRQPVRGSSSAITARTARSWRGRSESWIASACSDDWSRSWAARCSSSPIDYFADAPWRREPGGGPILHQHDPRGAQPAHAVRRDRRGAGVRFERDRAAFAVEDTVAINLRFASGALGTFMLSDTAACARNWEHTVAGEPGVSALRRRGLLRDQRHERQPVDPDHAAEDLRAAGRPLVVEAVRDASVAAGARRSAGAADRALRRGRPRRGGAARQRPRRPCRTCASPRRSSRPPAASARSRWPAPTFVARCGRIRRLDDNPDAARNRQGNAEMIRGTTEPDRAPRLPDATASRHR